MAAKGTLHCTQRLFSWIKNHTFKANCPTFPSLTWLRGSVRGCFEIGTPNGSFSLWRLQNTRAPGPPGPLWPTPPTPTSGTQRTAQCPSCPCPPCGAAAVGSEPTPGWTTLSQPNRACCMSIMRGKNIAGRKDQIGYQLSHAAITHSHTAITHGPTDKSPQGNKVKVAAVYPGCGSLVQTSAPKHRLNPPLSFHHFPPPHSLNGRFFSGTPKRKPPTPI